MPTYEYACRDCGHQLEVVQSFSDDALTECPACAGNLRKVFHAVGISFRGSGFYKTDSRNGSSSTKTPEPSESKPDAKPDTKAETKAETKTDTKKPDAKKPSGSSTSAA